MVARVSLCITLNWCIIVCVLCVCVLISFRICSNFAATPRRVSLCLCDSRLVFARCVLDKCMFSRESLFCEQFRQHDSIGVSHENNAGAQETMCRVWWTPSSRSSGGCLHFRHCHSPPVPNIQPSHISDLTPALDCECVVSGLRSQTSYKHTYRTVVMNAHTPEILRCCCRNIGRWMRRCPSLSKSVLVPIYTYTHFAGIYRCGKETGSTRSTGWVGTRTDNVLMNVVFGCYIWKRATFTILARRSINIDMKCPLVVWIITVCGVWKCYKSALMRLQDLNWMEINLYLWFRLSSIGSVWN